MRKGERTRVGTRHHSSLCLAMEGSVARRGPASSRLVGRGVLVWALAAVVARTSATHPETKWDARIDEACCAYPEHDPRDYNWPYSQCARSFFYYARARKLSLGVLACCAPATFGLLPASFSFGTRVPLTLRSQPAVCGGDP